MPIRKNKQKPKKPKTKKKIGRRKTKRTIETDRMLRDAKILRPLKDVDNEEWKEIKGSLCEISNYGRVRYLQKYSINGGVERERYMELPQRKDKESVEGDYYLRCTVQMPDIKDNYRERIHVLACTAFFGDRPEGCVPDHIDGDKLHNFCGTKENNYKDTNLEWVTSSENLKRAYKLGSFDGEKNTNKGVVRIEFTEDGEVKQGHVYTGTGQASKLTGVSQIQIIHNVGEKHKKTAKCHGSIYAYLDDANYHNVDHYQIRQKTAFRTLDDSGRVAIPKTLLIEMGISCGDELALTPVCDNDGNFLYLEMKGKGK